MEKHINLDAIKSALINVGRTRIAPISPKNVDIFVEIEIDNIGNDFEYGWAVVFKGRLLRPKVAEPSLLPALRRMLPKAERDRITTLSFDLDGKMTADLEAAKTMAGETLTAGTVFLALVEDYSRRQDLAAEVCAPAASDHR